MAKNDFQNMKKNKTANYQNEYHNDVKCEIFNRNDNEQRLWEKIEKKRQRACEICNSTFFLSSLCLMWFIAIQLGWMNGQIVQRALEYGRQSRISEFRQKWVKAIRIFQGGVNQMNKRKNNNTYVLWWCYNYKYSSICMYIYVHVTIFINVLFDEWSRKH